MPGLPLVASWCRRRDLNPHGFPAYGIAQPGAGAIRGRMAAIPDREGGDFLNFGLDQKRGEAQDGLY